MCSIWTHNGANANLALIETKWTIVYSAGLEHPGVLPLVLAIFLFLNLANSEVFYNSQIFVFVYQKVFRFPQPVCHEEKTPWGISARLHLASQPVSSAEQVFVFELRQINTCRKFPLHVIFLRKRHLALLFISLIFQRSL
jgi:hypothetical protein